MQDALDVVTFGAHEVASLAQLQGAFVGGGARRTATDEMRHGSKLSLADLGRDAAAVVEGELDHARKVRESALPRRAAKCSGNLRDTQHRRGVARCVNRRLLLHHSAHDAFAFHRRSFTGDRDPVMRVFRKPA